MLIFFLVQSHKNQIVARAKERAILVAEMNHHMRNALRPLALIMASPDTGERLRMLDIATDRMDHLLTDLLPTVGTASKPRYYWLFSRSFRVCLLRHGKALSRLLSLTWKFQGGVDESSFGLASAQARGFAERFMLDFNSVFTHVETMRQCNPCVTSTAFHSYANRN